MSPRNTRAIRLVSRTILVLGVLAMGAGLVAQKGTDAQTVVQTLLDTNRALQANNAAAFLSRFDRRRFSDYPRLESHLVALTEQSRIASSINVVEIRREGEDFHVQVDWLMQLSLTGSPNPVETRQELLEFRVAPGKKGKWKIAELKPVEFFRPQHDRGR